MIKREAVVGYFIQDDSVLLLKTHYQDGKEVWNGVSGFIDEGEDPAQALIREAREEIGVEINNEGLEKKHTETIAGILFHFYIVTAWRDELAPQEESIKELRWFPKTALPYAQMYEGDAERLPNLLV